MSELTHFDESGNAWMVDVGGKKSSKRTATASGSIEMSQKSFDAVKNKKIQKGDVLQIARIAGIMATKKTSEIIPLCHPIFIDKVSVDFEILEETNEIKCICTVGCTGVTGVEMEALTGVTAALLTIYDMCKAVDKSMIIKEVCLEEKKGGKSGDYRREI